MGESKTVIVAAVGDFMIDRRAKAPDIARVRTMLGGADIAIANVDTVLSDLGQPSPKYANLRGPRESVHDLREMGFDVVTIANNHAMDFRAEGMLDMRAAYQEAGVRSVGAGATIMEATAPAIFLIDGRRVAILSMACTIPQDAAAGPTWPGIAPVKVHQSYGFDPSLAAEQPCSMPAAIGKLDEGDLERSRADVAAARAEAEIVIVVVHWGVPAPWRAPINPIIQEHQRLLGHALIDAGADAVIGNHAHELHGIEFYQGKPIAYCLGNFWIDSISKWPWMGRETVVLRLGFPDAGDPEVEITSVLLDDDGVPNFDPDNRAVDLLRQFDSERPVQVSQSGELFRVSA